MKTLISVFSILTFFAFSLAHSHGPRERLWMLVWFGDPAEEVSQILTPDSEISCSKRVIEGGFSFMECHLLLEEKGNISFRDGNIFLTGEDAVRLAQGLELQDFPEVDVPNTAYGSPARRATSSSRDATIIATERHRSAWRDVRTEYSTRIRYVGSRANAALVLVID